MRFSALVPIILIAASFILAFLCLFAGSSKGFLEDYAVLTLNTSRIGYSIFNSSESSDNALTSQVSIHPSQRASHANRPGRLIDNISNSIENEIQEGINDIAQDIGIHDFYSAHLMNYCEGYYEPGPVPNNTVSKSQIHRNVTECSNRTSMYNFDPREILQKELNNSGNGAIDLLADLNWPEDIDKGIRALRIAAKAAFVLYCIAIGFIGIALLLAIISFFFDGRLSALLNMMVDWLAFLVIGIASAIATAIAVKGADVVNKYGDDIGVSAQRGNKFLILTWVSTGLMLVASIVWCFDCVVGRRRHAGGPKYG